MEFVKTVEIVEKTQVRGERICSANQLTGFCVRGTLIVKGLNVLFQERTKNAQFVIISLRNNMFELADRLVGIYKTDNCTKSVVVNPYLVV